MTKALWMVRKGELAPRTHMVGRLLEELGAPGQLVSAGTRLGDRYFDTRYPRADAGAAFAAVNESDAGTALSDAEEVMEWVRSHLPAR